MVERKPTKEELAAMLREFPTWGHAAVAYRTQRDEARALLLDVEGSILAYWTDLPETECERLRAKIRACLGGWEPSGLERGQKQP